MSRTRRHTIGPKGAVTLRKTSVSRIAELVTASGSESEYARGKGECLRPGVQSPNNPCATRCDQVWRTDIASRAPCRFLILIASGISIANYVAWHGTALRFA